MKDKFCKMCECAKSCSGNKLEKRQPKPKGDEPTALSSCMKKLIAQGHDSKSARAICSASESGMRKSDEEESGWQPHMSD